MTASDTASSDTARSVSFSGTGWPADPEPPRHGTGRDEARARIYRQLWQPPGRRPRPRQALGRPYVWDGTGTPSANGTANANGTRSANGTPSANGTRSADGPGPRERAIYSDRRTDVDRRAAGDRADALTGTAVLTERAVIGDELRLPTAWCQIGACVARHVDNDALGETDVRARAVALGWCVDLFGRLVCPACQQTYPVWSARPVLPRDELAVPDDQAEVTPDRRGGWPVDGAGFQLGRHRRTYGASRYGGSPGIY